MDTPLRSSFLQPTRTRASHEVYIPTIPIVTKVTAGLKLLYKRIKEETVLPQGQTDMNGKFIPTRNAFIAGRYNIQCCIATKGQTAVLIKAQDSYQQNQLVIIKVVHLTFLSAGLKEVFTLRDLNSSDPTHASHTVRLLNAFVYEGHICLVFPCYYSRPVTDVLIETCLSEQKLCSALRKISRHLLTALVFLRYQNLIHADVKPDNILVEEGGDLDTVTLIDFGNSLKPTQTMYYTDFDIQTLPYRAPEVHLGIPFGMEIDMWSVGCVLFECYTGQVLFNGKDRQEILNKIISVLGPPPVEMCSNANFSSDIKPSCGQHKSGALSLMTVFTRNKNYQFASFLSGMLTLDPEERMTPWEALQHPFMSAELCIPFYLGDSSSYPNGVVQLKDYEFKPALSSAIGKCGLSTSDNLKPGAVLEFSSAKQGKITSIAVSSPSNIKREPDKTQLCKRLHGHSPCKQLHGHTPLQDQTPCKPLQDQTLCKPLQGNTPYKCGNFNSNITQELITVRTLHKKSLTPENFSSKEKCRKWLQNVAESSLQHIGLCTEAEADTTRPDITSTATTGVIGQLDQSTCEETKSTLHTHDSIGLLYKDSSQRKIHVQRSETKKYQGPVSKSLFSESESDCRQKQSVLDKSPIAQTGSRGNSQSLLDKPSINDCKNASPAAMVESRITQNEYKNKRLIPDRNNSQSSQSVHYGSSRKRAPDDSICDIDRSLSIKKIKRVNPSSNHSLSCTCEDELQEADQSSGESSNLSNGDGHSANVGNNHNLNLTFIMQHTMMETSMNNKCLTDGLRKNPVIPSPKRNLARPHRPASPHNKQVPRSYCHWEKQKYGERDAKLVHVQHSDNKGDPTLAMNLSHRSKSQNESEHMLQFSEEKNSTYSKSNLFENSCTIPSRLNHHKSKAETQENIQKGHVTVSSPTVTSSLKSSTNSRNIVMAMLHSNAGTMLPSISDHNVSLNVTKTSLLSMNTNQTSSACWSCSVEEVISPGNNGHSSGSVCDEATSTIYKLPSTGTIFTESAIAKCETTSSSGLAKSRTVAINENGLNSSIQNKSIELSNSETVPSTKRNMIKSAKQVSCASSSMVSVRSSDQAHTFQHLTLDCPDETGASNSALDPESSDLLKCSRLPKKTEKTKTDRPGLVDEKCFQPKPCPSFVSKREAQSLDLETTYIVTKGRSSPSTKYIRSHNKSINVQTKSPEQKVSNQGSVKLPVVNSCCKPLQNQKLCNESYVIVQRKNKRTNHRHTVNTYHKENREVMKNHLNISENHSIQLSQNSHLDTVIVNSADEAYSCATDNTALNDTFERTVDSVNNNGPSSDSDETFDQTSGSHGLEDVSLLIE